MKRAVSSQELGLVAAEKLLGVEDLHYGYWDGRLELKPENARRAQEHYTDFLLSHLPGPRTGGRPTSVLDVGCGTGATLAKLLGLGYAADGLCPSPALCARVRERLAALPGTDAELFPCTFEQLPDGRCDGRYDVALFSESFQYIAMPAALGRIDRILRPEGAAVICDFFRTERHGDGGPGDKSFGGGHDLREFHGLVGRSAFRVDADLDITGRISPNLELLNDVLMNRVLPVLELTDAYLEGRNPWIYRPLRWLARRRVRKLRYKYFSGHRSRATFERYKSYRLIVLRRRVPGAPGEGTGT